MSVFIVLTIAVIFAQTEAKFPNNPKPCKYGDTSCIKDILNFVLHEKSGGYSSLNVVEFDPLKISGINIKQGKESPVNIDLRLTNIDLLGLKTAQAIEIKGFGKDLAGQNEIQLKIPVLNLIGDYTVSGKVLILPVQGTGKSNITLTNSDVGIYVSGTPQVKPDGTYFKIKSMRLNVEPKRVYFYFENLFNGDKTLGDNFNLFLNENWEDIFRELKNSVDKAFAQVFESIINNAFQKYPYDKLFIE